MKYNLKKSILILFILIATFLLGTEQQIPVETITENPVKEVTTVESKKNKESAELNIKVKKRNIEEIEGVDTATGIEFVLPNGSLLENEEIKVVKSLANLPEETSKNKRKKRNLSTIETPSIIIESGDKKIVKIAKEEAENTNYIIKIDKNSNEINKIYKGRTRREAVSRWNPPSDGNVNTGEGWQDQILIRLGANGDNTLAVQTTYKHLRVWNNKWWLAGVGFGFENEIYHASKYGNASDILRLKISRVYNIQGKGNMYALISNGTKYANGGGLSKRSDGGYVANKALSFHAFTSSYSSVHEASDIDVEMEFKIDSELSSQTYYSKTGGVFSVMGIPEYGVKVNDVNGKWNRRYIPRELLILATRYPRNTTININKSQLDTNLNISLLNSGLTNSLGYEGSGKTIYNVTDMDASGISLNSSGLRFPTNLKSGTYKLNVVWLGNDHRYDNNNINGPGDTITINYVNDIEIGEVEFVVDQRLKTASGNWVRANGGVSNEIEGSVTSYPELVILNNNFSNLESVRITDVNSIEGRNNKLNFTGYKLFTPASSIWVDEAAMPFDINLNELRNNLIISMLNSNDSNMLNNRFSVLGQNGVSYKGNVKEIYVGKVAQSGVATLDMTSVPVMEWSGWNTPGVSGDANSTAGRPTVMKFKSGELFNFISAAKLRGGHIVTKLKVTNNGVIDEVIASGVNKRLETSKFNKNKIGIAEGGSVFIHKYAEDPNPETYEIEAYYNDILLGKLNLTITNTSEINIGEVVFKVDSRIPKRKLIFSNGDIKNTRDGNVENNYSEFVNLEGNFINLEATEINEVISVEGRPVKNSSFVSSNTARFDVANGTNIDSSYIPLNFNLSSIKDKGLIDNTNSNPLASGMENNIFTLKGANGKFYKGNIKETYVGKDAQSGVATLDMSSVPVIEWSGWNTPGVSGDANSTAGRPTVMKFKSGELFNFRSAAEPTGGHIVTKLKVTNNGIVDEIIGSGVNKRLETSKFNKNKIGITEGGSVFIHKYTEDTNPETYEIEAYYNDILLGKLDLTVVNSEEIDIGKINFEIDKRINKKYGTWIFRTGDTKSSLNDLIPKNNISEFINLDGEFTNLESVNITDVISMENRPVKHATLGGYKVFLIGAGNYNDEGAIPFNINLNTLKEHIVVSLNTSKFLDNIFTLKGANGKFYKGNIKETYVGKDAQSGVATLDMSSVSTNEGSRWTRWDTPGATGNVNSTAGSPTVMKFKSGELFNFRSAVEPNGGHIVTKLKVTNNGIVDEIIGLGVNTKLETTKFLKNIIGIDSGGLFISKKINDTIPETYEIEAYYNEMLLGKLNLTISNSIPIEIGTINYKVDNRFRNYLEIINSKWLNGEGGFSRDKYEWDNGLNADRQYSLLVEKTGDIIMKSRVSSWSQAMGRTLVDGNWGNKSIYSKKYNPSVDGLALPNTKINSGFIETEADFLKYSVFSFVDLSKGMKENNILMYEGIDGKIYVIRMNLEVGNEENGLGKGEIDSIKLKPNETYTFERSKTGEISSFEDSNVKLKLISGTLPRPQSYTSQNIVNKLKVTFNDGGEEIAVGNIYENNKYKIELDQTTGNFKITKKSSDILASDKIKIDYLYNEVKLGEFLLEIKGSKFEIIGDDIIDFGKIIQGKESRIEGNIVVRNLTSQRIVRAELNTLNPLKMLKKDNKTIEMPVNKSILLLDKGTEVPIKIDLKAKPEIDQAIGDYEGELNLYIYIE